MNTFFERVARALRAPFATVTTTTTRSSRPMTAAEAAAFDRAFAKFNEGFDELSKTFDREQP